MEVFIRSEIDGEKAEFLIDESLFSKDIVMKAAYNFLDKAYFFFKKDEGGNLLVQVTKKEECEWNIDKIIGELSDEMLAVCLRVKLEQDNKIIREAIITKALYAPVDEKNFVTLDTSGEITTQQNQIDFDKDIDDILREIENDPELKIDEDEIAKILAEIEAESQEFEIQKPTITLDVNAIANVKQKFSHK